MLVSPNMEEGLLCYILRQFSHCQPPRKSMVTCYWIGSLFSQDANIIRNITSTSSPSSVVIVIVIVVVIIIFIIIILLNSPILNSAEDHKQVPWVMRWWMIQKSRTTTSRYFLWATPDLNAKGVKKTPKLTFTLPRLQWLFRDRYQHWGRGHPVAFQLKWGWGVRRLGLHLPSISLFVHQMFESFLCFRICMSIYATTLSGNNHLKST